MYNSYLQKSSLPIRLDKDEEAELLNLVKDGDLLARNKLIEHNLRLVIYIAKRYVNQIYSLDDLFSVGVFGLMAAIERCNKLDIQNFGNYAARCIDRKIQIYIRNNKKYIIPSLDAPNINNSDNGNLKLIDTIASESYDFTNRIIRQENKKEISEIIRYLPKNQKLIIDLRYTKKLSQHEIAKLLNVSQSYIHKLEHKALRMIRILVYKYNSNIYLNQQEMEKEINALTIEEKMMLAVKGMIENNLTLDKLSEEYHFNPESMRDMINNKLPEIDNDLYLIIEPALNFNKTSPLDIASYSGVKKYSIEEKNQKFIKTISKFSNEKRSSALQSLPEINRLVLEKGLGLIDNKPKSYQEIALELGISFRTVVAMFAKTKIMLYNKLTNSKNNKKVKKVKKVKKISERKGNFQKVISKYSKIELSEVLESLKPINRYILEKRFNLFDDKLKSFDELASELHITRKQVIYLLDYTKKLVCNRLVDKNWKNKYKKFACQAKKDRAYEEFMNIINQFTEEEFLEIFNGLSITNQQILKNKLGLNKSEIKSNSEIAKDINLSTSTVGCRYARLKTFFYKKLISKTSDESNLSLFKSEDTTSNKDFEIYRPLIKEFIGKLQDQNEQTVLLLSLGYIRNKFYNENEIANIQKVDQNFVHITICNALNNLLNILSNDTLFAEEIREYLYLIKNNTDVNKPYAFVKKAD